MIKNCGTFALSSLFNKLWKKDIMDLNIYKKITRVAWLETHVKITYLRNYSNETYI